MRRHQEDFISSPATTAANNGPTKANRSIPGARTRNPATQPGTASIRFGTSQFPDPRETIGGDRPRRNLRKSDLQIGRRLERIKLDRLAPTFDRRFMQFRAVEAQACGFGGLT